MKAKYKKNGLPAADVKRYIENHDRGVNRRVDGNSGIDTKIGEWMVTEGYIGENGAIRVDRREDDDREELV